MRPLCTPPGVMGSERGALKQPQLRGSMASVGAVGARFLPPVAISRAPGARRVTGRRGDAAQIGVGRGGGSPKAIGLPVVRAGGVLSLGEGLQGPISPMAAWRRGTLPPLTITRAGRGLARPGPRPRVLRATAAQHGDLTSPARLHIPSGAHLPDISVSVSEELARGGGEGAGSDTERGKLVGVGILLAVAALMSTVALNRGHIFAALTAFGVELVAMGPAGCVVYMAAYILMELVGVPVLPLTLSAGVLYGVPLGVALASLSATSAAAIAFLISRYLARDKVLQMAQGNKTFKAIDSAIGREGFKVVLMLRLSPLLPLSLGNYLYGLTSVELAPYTLATLLGFLPGTWGIVMAGRVSKAALGRGGEGLAVSWWQVALGLGAAVGVSTFVTRLAQESLNDTKGLEGLEGLEGASA